MNPSNSLHFTYKGAQFSDDRIFRYALWRTWDEGQGHVMFIGLNPSTADENVDDPTVRRCIGFAKAWGYGGVYMLNLFALRSTDPARLREVYRANVGQAAYEAVVGPSNDRFIEMYAKAASKVVAAWGTGGEFCHRYERAEEIVETLHCLGTTKAGQPRHPLYVPKSARLEVWPAQVTP